MTASVASDWFRRFEGAGLDGVIAKPVSGTYEPDKRVMLKVKHERDCDCVVAGFRWHKKGERTAVGSLLLGLFDGSGSLQHVGVCASFAEEKRHELTKFLEPYRKDALKDHPWKQWATAGEDGQRMPGGQSRWSQGKDLSWEPLRPELVAEVAYEHMQGNRFRHLAHFRRWRTDKTPTRLYVCPARSSSAPGAGSTFSPKAAEIIPISSEASSSTSPAILVSDRRLGQASPAMAAALQEHAANSLGCESMSTICRAWNRPVHRPRRVTSSLGMFAFSIVPIPPEQLPCRRVRDHDKWHRSL